MKKLIASLLLSGVLFCEAQESVNIIPRPVSVKQPPVAGSFALSSQALIAQGSPAVGKSASFLNDYLERIYHIRLSTSGKASKPATVKLAIVPGKSAVAGSYTLTINAKGVSIQGQDETGVFYGIQTLIQLLPVNSTQAPLSLPYISIEDYPRFAYRGLMLDAGRHFFPVEYIKKYIDYIALHKMNSFHWHLTEDQGWRVEIKKYPKLTETGGFRNGTIVGRYPGKGSDNQPYGGFYTQEQIKEVVKYAADRYINIIPEIELPGHSSAAIAAYPQLSCFPDSATDIPQNMISQKSKDELSSGRVKLVQETWGVFKDVYAPTDYTFNFLQDVLDEIIPLFPGKYIHIGGDECPKESWKQSAFCQNLIKEKGLKDEHGLQSYFIGRIEKYINSKGKSIIGWDEILEGGLAPNATVMSWRGEEGGIAAARQNHDVVMAPNSYVYFDYAQSRKEDSVTIGGFIPLEKVYNYEPIPSVLTPEEGKHILGGQANLWTEYIAYPSKVEYMIFPRASALSEVLWSPKTGKDYADFEKRLQTQFKRYELWKANYSKAYFDISASLSSAADHTALEYKLESKLTGKGPKIYYTRSSTGSQQMEYINPIRISGSEEITASLLANGKPLANPLTQKFSFNKATAQSITLSQPPAPKWSGFGGASGLVNGIVSEKGISSPEWLGWNGGDIQAIIDLGKTQDISSVNCHLLEQPGSWIYLPSSVEVFTSADGNNYTPAGKTGSYTKGDLGMYNATIGFPSLKSRFVKIIAHNMGQIPEGKAGAGNPAWLFADEIQIN